VFVLSRIIECETCHKHLGEVRDATLRNGIVHLCSSCNLVREAVGDRLDKLLNKGKYSPGGDITDLFNDIFNGR